MSYRGRYCQGENIDLIVQTKNAAGTPTMPDRAPTVEVWGSEAKVATFQLPIVDRYTATAIFQGNLFLGASYPPDNYRTVFLWTTGNGAFNGIEESGFEVVPGGDQRGSVIAMYYFNRPNGQFIVQQRDSGVLVQGTNPSI